MIELATPRGLPVNVPEVLAEDAAPRFAPHEAEKLRAYYEENGYVIVKSLFSPEVCDAQRRLWEKEVKPFAGYIYRQATAKAERHVFNEKGWVMNPILNLQSVDPKYFRGFREHATERVLAAPALREVFKVLLKDAPKIVQSMYFEGNSATWEHQDSYYLDSEKIGEMAAAWIAIEPIAARAGRFFVCPRSHKIRMEPHGIDNNVVEHHERYISSVVRRIKELKLDIRAPVLDKGDVLFWNALTIHGSLDSQDAKHSRSSITCHAIPSSRLFLKLQARLQSLPAVDVNGTRIHRPKDLGELKNRLIFQAETRFPSFFYWVKRAAVKQLLRHSSQTKDSLQSA
jgi:phytanoyl-CoA hydroxylase